MSSFGAKNILRHDIVTQNIFFNDSESITNYLPMKKPEFSYTNLPALSIITKRNLPHIPKEIKDCIKQHMMIYESGKEVVLNTFVNVIRAEGLISKNVKMILKRNTKLK